MELSEVTYQMNGEMYHMYVVAKTRDEAYSTAIKVLRQRGYDDFISAVVVSDAYIKFPIAFEGAIFDVEGDK